MNYFPIKIEGISIFIASYYPLVYVSMLNCVIYTFELLPSYFIFLRLSPKVRDSTSRLSCAVAFSYLAYCSYEFLPF